ncbi:MAG: hypothetical protein M0Q51_02875 [Bacteroidales bacterium]|nr:hypothetical protein [Bacteroidales bacterium]
MPNFQINDFIKQPGMPEIIARAEKIAASGKAYSDVLDVEGHQYVDLVQGFIEGKPKWYLWLKGLSNIKKIISLVNQKLGINPGIDFEEWIRENMSKNGIKSTKDLQEYRSKFSINVFHNSKVVPRLPTFGVRLSSYRNEYKEIRKKILEGSTE